MSNDDEVASYVPFCGTCFIRRRNGLRSDCDNNKSSVDKCHGRNRGGINKEEQEEEEEEEQEEEEA